MTLNLAIDLEAPARMSRAHLLVRLLIACVTGMVASAVGWPGAVVYFAVPAVVAVLISQHGVNRYLSEDSPILTRFLGWFMGFYAYMGLLTDRFPLGGPDEPVRYEGTPQGRPSVGSAVLRVVASVPIVIVLAVIGIASAVLWALSAIAVLFVEHYPRSWFDFQCGVLRLQGRMLAYHASLVQDYPRISIDLGPTGGTRTPADALSH